MTKLTSYDKTTIREWYYKDQYTQAELAAIYEVSRSTIQRVLKEPDFAHEYYGVGTVPTYDGQEMGTDDAQVESDLPPEWLAWALVGLTVAGAGLIGWLIYNAI